MMVTDRLFAVEATATERAKRTKSNRAAQGSMFDAPEASAWSCPACGGDRERCSCATTGAQALALELDEPAALDDRPAYPPPGGTPLTRTRDSYAAHSAAMHDHDETDDEPPCVNCGRGDGPVCSMCGARSTFGNQDPETVDRGRYWRVLALELNEQHPAWIGRDADDLRSWLAHDVTAHMRDENANTTQTYGHERDRLASLAAPILQRAHNALAGPLYADHDRWANSTCAGESCPCELCGGEAHYRPALRVDYCTAGTLARQLAEREYPHAYEPKSKRTDACRHCYRGRADCTATLDPDASTLL